VQAELAQDVGHIALGGAGCDNQNLGDLLLLNPLVIRTITSRCPSSDISAAESA
jgi:hypothetical protein